jgi:hypothetical protein
LPFPKEKIAFPAVPAGNYGGVLIEVADQLCAELSYAESGGIPGALSTLAEEGVMARMLSPKDESLVSSVREGLARVAAAVAAGSVEPSLRAVQIALDGAEMVMRGELVSGNEDRLPSLMPSFVFLVALPTVGQNRALALSRRAQSLVEEELRRSELR